MNKFRELREKKGFTQKYVAYVLGVSRVAATKWESGATFPRHKMLPKVAKLLGAKVSDFFVTKRNLKCLFREKDAPQREVQKQGDELIAKRRLRRPGKPVSSCKDQRGVCCDRNAAVSNAGIQEKTGRCAL